MSGDQRMRYRVSLWLWAGAFLSLVYGVFGAVVVGQPVIGAVAFAIGGGLLVVGLVLSRDINPQSSVTCSSCGATFDDRLFVCPTCGRGR